jgi:hypothetical protein
VTKAAIDKARPTANPLPAAQPAAGRQRVQPRTPPGLFGGNLRVRGFNSDQMGFTINGAPVNDWATSRSTRRSTPTRENLCEIFLTQGAADTDAPHVGASGGNVGLVSCGPNGRARRQGLLSIGQLNFRRSLRCGVDTGLLGTDRQFKGFVSLSRTPRSTSSRVRQGRPRPHGCRRRVEDHQRHDVLAQRAVQPRDQQQLPDADARRSSPAPPTPISAPPSPQHLASGNEATTANFA